MCPSGGGGSSGGATLESLMDRISFRGKPKIVDLTSSRKLADKVSHQRPPTQGTPFTHINDAILCCPLVTEMQSCISIIKDTCTLPWHPVSP
jgi:hypothetical protein